MQLSPHCIVPRVSSCVIYWNLHWEKSMGESQFFPINFSPILKHTGVPRLYPRTQTNCNVKRDGVWQVWQPDAVCQMPSEYEGKAWERGYLLPSLISRLYVFTSIQTKVHKSEV